MTFKNCLIVAYNGLNTLSQTPGSHQHPLASQEQDQNVPNHAIVYN